MQASVKMQARVKIDPPNTPRSSGELADANAVAEETESRLRRPLASFAAGAAWGVEAVALSRLRLDACLRISFD